MPNKIISRTYKAWENGKFSFTEVKEFSQEVDVTEVKKNCDEAKDLLYKKDINSISDAVKSICVFVLAHNRFIENPTESYNPKDQVDALVISRTFKSNIDKMLNGFPKAVQTIFDLVDDYNDDCSIMNDAKKEGIEFDEVFEPLDKDIILEDIEDKIKIPSDYPNFEVDLDKMKENWEGLKKAENSDSTQIELPQPLDVYEVLGGIKLFEEKDPVGKHSISRETKKESKKKGEDK